MSSILDALNKLEEEKAARQAEVYDDEESPASPEEAAAELLGTSRSKTLSDRKSLPWLPMVSALFVGVVLTIVVAVAVFRWNDRQGPSIGTVPAGAESTAVHTYTLDVASSSTLSPSESNRSGSLPTETQAVAAPTDGTKKQTLLQEQDLPKITVSAPTPVPENKVVETDPRADGSQSFAPDPEAPSSAISQTRPREESDAFVEKEPPVLSSSETEPTHAVNLAAAMPLSAQNEQPVGVTQQEQAQPAPGSDQNIASEMKPASPPFPESIPLPTAVELQQATREPVSVPAVSPSFPSRMTNPPQARTERGEVDVDSLPRLSANERSRLGLDSLRLNVLREAGNEQPDAMAIINLKKVYVGEMIPNTRVRLIGVKSNGIGVEVEGSGERYRIPR